MTTRLNKPVIPRTKRDLSPPRRWLVELMQRMNFCRIENLQVRGGDPVLDPPPRILREVKMGGGDNGPRPELHLADFALLKQHLELFRVLDEIGDGVLATLTCKHGMPFFGEVVVRAG